MTITFEQACEALEIDITNISYSNLTCEYVKKQYHKLALKYHPDKTNGNLDSLERFKQINEAYRFLIESELLNLNTNVRLEKGNNVYMSLLTTFITDIIKGDYKDTITAIIKEIILGYKTISTKLFNKIDKQTSLEIYSFLKKYKHILYLNDNIVEQVRLIILEKYENDKIYILNPCIDDLLENKLYKLQDNGELYLVPLWFNEVFFDDKNGNEIIVLCEPELPEDITIDDNKNVYKTITVHKQDLFGEQTNISILIGKKTLEIPIHKLYIKKHQFYILKGQGISIGSDMYEESPRSDVICQIQIV